MPLKVLTSKIYFYFITRNKTSKNKKKKKKKDSLGFTHLLNFVVITTMMGWGKMCFSASEVLKWCPRCVQIEVCSLLGGITMAVITVLSAAVLMTSWQQWIQDGHKAPRCYRILIWTCLSIFDLVSN